MVIDHRFTFFGRGPFPKYRVLYSTVLCSAVQYTTVQYSCPLPCAPDILSQYFTRNCRNIVLYLSQCSFQDLLLWVCVNVFHVLLWVCVNVFHVLLWVCVNVFHVLLWVVSMCSMCSCGSVSTCSMCSYEMCV